MPIVPGDSNQRSGLGSLGGHDVGLNDFEGEGIVLHVDPNEIQSRAEHFGETRIAKRYASAKTNLALLQFVFKKGGVLHGCSSLLGRLGFFLEEGSEVMLSPPESQTTPDSLGKDPRVNTSKQFFSL